MVYKWRYTMPVPAEKAGAELERLEKKHGHISPQIVLDSSRKENAPLHKCFEWNDTTAAEKYRLTQAGQIINNLVVVLDEYEHHEPVRAFVNVVKNAPARAGEFLHISSAMQEDESREIILANALRELKEFEKKYKELGELAGIFSEIGKLKITA